jgi:hypothetical protein
MTETEGTVTMSRAEYEDLVDARDHAIAMWKIAVGDMLMIPDEEMDAYLALVRASSQPPSRRRRMVAAVPFIRFEADD